MFVGYRMGQPNTVVERIDMWLAPWDNDVHGGNQLAHSIWAFSTGGPTGSGPGWGDPEMIPAGNTDLVLPAIGEEWGFAGVVAVFLLLGFLVARALRAAARAETHFGFFLALGLACLIAYEMLLISSGVLGVLPLSGVVSPFLSSGNTAMLANFLIFAMLAAISADRRPEPLDDLLRLPLRSLERGAGGHGRGPGGRGGALPGLRRPPVPGARRQFLRRRRRQAAAAQPAAELDCARDSARNHLRPQRHSARHQQLGGTGTPSRRI